MKREQAENNAHLGKCIKYFVCVRFVIYMLGLRYAKQHHMTSAYSTIQGTPYQMIDIQFKPQKTKE